MKKSTILLFSLLILPLLLHSSALGNISNSTMVQVNGKITNGQNTPLKLEFDFSNGTQLIQQYTSSSNGIYNFDLQKGTWNWKFASVDKEPDMPRFFEVEKTMMLQKNYSDNLIPQVFTMTGQLKDNNGNIINGGTVDSGVCPISIGNFTGTQEDIVSINSTGYYILHLLPSTCNSIKITTSSGFTFFPLTGRTININSNSTNNLVLASTVKVSGKLTDSFGNPVSATIEFVGTDYVERSTTDSNGNYSFSIPSGTYTIKFSQNNANVHLPRFFDIEKIININSNQTNNVTLNSTSISGTITFKSATINVRNNVITNNGYGGFSIDRMDTDSNGTFNGKLMNSTNTQVTIQNFSGDGSTITCTIHNGVITC